MKALILAAGYATRLYPLTENQPKSLLQVGKKVMLEHILEKVESIPLLNEVLIVTNHRFYDHFRKWLNGYPSTNKIRLVDDGTVNNHDRLGAVGDINFVLKEEDIDEDLLVIAGDNLFGFSLKDFLAFFQQEIVSIVALRDLKDKEKVRKKYGVAEIEGSKIAHFEEKPLEPKSSLASTACYLFTSKDLRLVEKSVEQGKADNPGDLIKWLVQRSEVHGFVFTEPWFDVGSFESLQEAEKLYSHPS